MARRDVDIVVAARTDESSFAKTEKKIKGMLDKLRGQARAGGGGGLFDPNAGTGAAGAVERLDAFRSKLAAVAAVAIVAQNAVHGFNAAVGAMDAATGLARGNLAEFDSGIVKVKDSLKEIPILRDALALGESIFGDDEKAKKILSDAEKRALKQAKEHKKTVSILEKVEQIEQRIAEEKRLAGKEGVELELERLKIATERRIKELEALDATTRDKRAELAIEKAIASVKENAARKAEEIRSRSQSRSQESALNPNSPANARAGIVSGRLLTGAAQSSADRLGGIIRAAEAQRRKDAAEQRRKDEERNQILADLLRGLRPEQAGRLLQ